ncbi:histidine kinase [bacterium SCSIO 12741]|nr:histidine kinase [bacterium SCSIO 12741]
MSTLLKHFLFVLFLGISSWASAQYTRTFSFMHFDQEQGLQGSSVYGLSQDDHGYIWVGTDKGVSRFDGTVFEYYPLQRPQGYDAAERIFKWTNDWQMVVGSHDSLLYLIQKDKPLRALLHRHGAKPVTFVQSPEDQSIAFYNREVITVVDTQLNRREINLNKQKFQWLFAYPFSSDSLFVSNNKETYLIGQDSILLPGVNFITALLPLEDSTLLFGKDKIYALKNGKVQTVRHLDEVKEYVQYAVRDPNGNIWLSGYNEGLYLLQGDRITEVSSSLGFSGDQVTYLFIDRSGNLWISTQSSGLFCLVNNPFTSYSTVDGLSSGHILCMEWTQSGLLVGTSKGINRVNKTGIVGPWNLAQEYDLNASEREALSGYVSEIQDQGERIFYATHVFNSNPRWDKTKGLVDNVFSASIHYGDTVFSGRWGLLILKDRNNLRRNLKRIPGNHERFSKEYFIRWLDRGQHLLLLGTSNGLFTVKSDLEELQRLQVPEEYAYVKFFDALRRPGEWWFATSVGVLVWDGGDTWNRYGTEHGLLSNTVRCLIEDDQHRMWVGTDQGLNLYYDDLITGYTEGNGLISKVVQALAYDSVQQQLWVGTNKGLTRIDLDRIEVSNRVSFPVRIDALELMGDTTLFDASVPEFTWQQNNLRLHYGSINYTNPSGVNYAYRLMPVDTQWHHTQQNVAEYVGLGPGQYRFEVRSKVPGTVWGEVAHRSFIVHAPFWKTAKFLVTILLLLLLLFGFILWSVLRAEKRRALKRQKFIQKINELEQQALNLSMNPHFIFNSLNTIQHYYSHIKNREANRFMADFAQLIRLNLDSSRKGSISLSEEVRRLEIYMRLEQARMDRPFEKEIHVAGDLKTVNLQLPNMIIQPLVENAIWHGVQPLDGPGKIEIRIYRQTNMLIIQVKDNGVGLQAAQSKSRKGHQSHGLSITRERLKMGSENNYLLLRERTENGDPIGGTLAEIGIELNF